jgi:GAF domain
MNAMTAMNEFDNLFSRGEELAEMLRRGRRFSEELMTENEKLRLQILKGESDMMRLQTALTTGTVAAALKDENVQLRERVVHLEARFGEIAAENQDFATRYAEISEENESLASLYVASCRLHSTLDPADVTEIVCEILIELVGAEEFALLLLDERSNELALIRIEGPATLYPAHILVGDGPIGTVVRDGRPSYREPPPPGMALAVIPLQIKGNSVGAIVITRLLHGKQRLSGIAKELLTLLAGHAATALTASRLYTSVDRKLRTIEGFMELMKKPPEPVRRA